MEIKYAKFYQAIRIHDSLIYKTVTYIDADENTGNLQPNCTPKMYLLDNGSGLMVETPTDNVIITLNNIAYMNAVKPEIKKRAEAAGVPKSKQVHSVGPVKPT